MGVGLGGGGVRVDGNRDVKLVKIQKKIGGGQGGWQRRIEAFVKIQKKIEGGGVWVGVGGGVRSGVGVGEVGVARFGVGG